MKGFIFIILRIFSNLRPCAPSQLWPEAPKLDSPENRNSPFRLEIESPCLVYCGLANWPLVVVFSINRYLIYAIHTQLHAAFFSEPQICQSLNEVLERLVHLVFFDLF